MMGELRIPNEYRKHKTTELAREGVAELGDRDVDYYVDQNVYLLILKGELATTTTIRVTVSDRDIAQELATRAGRSQMDIVHDALELYRRQQLLAEMNQGFAELRRDPDAWSEEMAERDVWDITLGDATGG
jgi:hypothetical protein